MSEAASTPTADPGGHAHAPFKVLALGALGVVFGDIGTSPLYTLKECLHASAGEARGAAAPALVADVFGLLSLIFWSLTLVVTVKYITFIMKADHEGEGGIFALLAVVPERLRVTAEHHLTWVSIMVVVGAALLYGDGMITPAISVLSAVEGLGVASPSLVPLILPITCAILIGLFMIQSRGTGEVGKVFGPVMAVWFSTIALLGLWQIVHYPSILGALSPHHALDYFSRHGMPGFLVLGSVVLAVTGGEALYADMGHFGVAPIRLVWMAVVFPALILCYFGQGALVLRDHAAAENPFFAMVPSGLATYLLVALSSAATVIASQALISGAFSLTRQAMSLGFFPRVTVRHTAVHTEGQIYIPEMNWILAAGCLFLVLTFRASERLASAYGIAVTGTMAITSVVFYVVMRETWGWSRLRAVPLLLLFLSFDLPFFGSNLFKLVDGGWVPVLIGLVIITGMLIWNKGRTLVIDQYTRRFPHLDHAFPDIMARLLYRSPGTGVFLASLTDHVPPMLMHQVNRLRVLHERVVLITVKVDPVAEVPPEKRLELLPAPEGFVRIVAHYGFVDQPDVVALMQAAEARGVLKFEPEETTYFLGRETILATDRGQMGWLAETIFSILQRHSLSADRSFGVPPHLAFEVGVQLDL